MPQRKIDSGRRRVAERPRAPRRTVRLRVPVQGQEGAASDLEILNISTTGILFRHPATHESWTSVEIMLPNGKCVSGSVSWTDGDLVGFKFDTAISKADLAAVMLKGQFLGPLSSAAEKPRPSEKDILSNLSELRAAAGMSMEALAEKVGVSRQAIWYWEQGRSVPRPAARRALLQALGGARNQSAVGSASPPTTFETKVDRFKIELADYLGIETSAIRIIVDH